MRGRRFSSNEEPIDTVTTWFEDEDKEFYFKKISFLKDKWNQCIELVEDDIEK